MNTTSPKHRILIVGGGAAGLELATSLGKKLGIITGFQELLDQLEVLRKIDLGSTPPAADIPAK